MRKAPNLDVIDTIGGRSISTGFQFQQMLRSSRRQKLSKKLARNLYGQVVEQARQPEFYARGGVPDTPEGRFELIAVHAFLVMHRLKGAGDEAAAVSQALFDTMFDDMDRNLREMGVGDLGVGKRVKAMAKSYYGRIHAYETGLAGDGDGTLIDALTRNLYGTSAPSGPQLDAMAAYMRREADALARSAVEQLLSGRMSFGPPPRLA